MTEQDLKTIAEKARRIAMLSTLGAAATGYVQLEDGNVAMVRILVKSEDDVAELVKAGRAER